MKGIKVNGDIVSCGNCEQVLSKDNSKMKLNFCPKCGNPLNIEAQIKRENEITKEKLILLYEIMDRNSEGEDLENLIKQFVVELKEDLK